MKGQYLTVEYVIFFAIGLALIIGVFFSFGNVNSRLKEVAVQGQVDRTAEMIRSSIVNVYLASKNTESTISYDLAIPTKLSGSIYNIRELDNKLNVNSTDNYNIGKVLTLYGIPFSQQDIIYSTNGKITIRAFKDVSTGEYGVVLS